MVLGRGRRGLAAAAAGFLLAALAGCGGTGTKALTYTSAWSTQQGLIVTNYAGRPVLLGLDSRTASVNPLVEVAASGDPRRSSYAQTSSLGPGRDLLVLPGEAGANDAAYLVDRATEEITPTSLPGGVLHLARLGGALFGVRAAGTGAELVEFGPSLEAARVAHLPRLPAYYGVDESSTTACYASSEDGRAFVSTVDAKTLVVTPTDGPVAGAVTAVACGAGKTFLATASAEGAAPAAGVGGLLLAPWSKDVVLVTAGRGAIEAMAYDAASGHLLVDAPGTTGRLLVEVDPATGGTVRTTPLPGIDAVHGLVLGAGSVVLVGSDRAVFLDRASGRTRSATLPGTSYATNASGY